MAIKEVLAFFDYSVQGTDKLAAADKQTTKLERSIKSLGKVLATAGVLAIGKGIFNFINDTADAADQTDKFATALGVSARDVAEWDHILGNAGLSIEETRKGLQTFSKQAGAAAAGNKALRATFRELGVQTRDNTGQLRPLNDRLTDAVLGLEKIEDPARRAAEAQRLFGRSGLGFVRVALDGADALAEQRREFETLHGGGSYEQFVQDSKAAAIANDRWRNATRALRTVIAGALIPVLTRVVVWISSTTKAFTQLLAGTKIVQTTFAVLGAAAAAFAVKMAIAFAPAILTIGAFVAVVGGSILLIEDLYQLFSGGESLIGRWLESFIGAGQTKALVDGIKNAVLDLGGVLKFFGEVGTAIWRALQEVVRQTKLLIEDLVELVTDAIDKIVQVGETARKFVGGVVEGPEILVTTRDGRKISLSQLEAELQEGQRQTAATSTAPIQLPGPAAERPRPVLERSVIGGVTTNSQAVTVNAPTQITVQGSADESTVDAIMEAMDAREQETLRRARDLAAAR